MKKLILWTLLLLLLTGCASPGTAPASDPAASLPTEHVQTTEPAVPTDSKEPAPTETTAAPTTAPGTEAAEEAIRQWLTEPCSFTVGTLYHYFPYFFIEVELCQVSGQDGSMNFRLSNRYVNNSDGTDETERVDYHYRYEDGAFVCYLRNEAARGVLSASDQQNMDRDKQRIIGPDALLPAGLSEFRDAGPDAESGCQCFTWQVPLSVLRQKQSYLGVFIENCARWGDASLEGADPVIGFTLYVDAGTFRPVRLEADFTAVKPLVLPDGALSGEYAMDLDLMTAVLTFDYDLAETVTPEFSLETWELEPDTEAP